MYKSFGNRAYSLVSRSVELARVRSLCVMLFFAIAFAVLIFRLSVVMLFNGGDSRQVDGNAPAATYRADIVDRNNVIIATSLPTVSLYASPHEILDYEEAAGKISKVFSDIDKNVFLQKLKSAKKFLWVKRNLSPKQEQEVLNQGLPGFHFLKTEKRVYPDKSLVSHIIGGTDIDNIGIAGIEKAFDEALRSSNQPIKLSIDVNIQHAVREELKKSISEFRALGGAAIVMEIASGEVLALLSISI
ncbi:MAG: penicillin-binding protein 2, partial [Alphaproteobacteria bacterium]|nr:penicillin-binding protein 2 [Alphaproteobacteria bacterium]